MFPLVFGGTRATDSGAKSPSNPFNSKEAGSQKLSSSETPEGASSGGGIKKGRAQIYNKYGTSTEITAQDEWTVIGNQAHRSDVELVALGKQLALGLEPGYVGSNRRDPDQWSGDTETTAGLPIQGRPSQSV